jgi:hypothetical protein
MGTGLYIRSPYRDFQTKRGQRGHNMATLPSECRKRKPACITKRSEGSEATTWITFPSEVRVAGPQRGHITERAQETKACLYYRTSAGNKSLLVLPNECRERKLACIAERVPETKACLHYQTKRGQRDHNVDHISKRSESSEATTWITFPSEVRVARRQRGSHFQAK